MVEITSVPKPGKTSKKSKREIKPKDTAIQLSSGGDLKIPGVPGEITPVSLVLDPALSFDAWAEFGTTLASVRQGSAWWIGDWILHGERTYGEQYAQAADATMYDPQTLANMASVANRVPVENRRDDLSWSHHSEVAKFKPDVQWDWLERAAQNGWGVSTLRSIIKDESGTRTLPEEAPLRAVQPELEESAPAAAVSGDVFVPQATNGEYEDDDEAEDGLSFSPSEERAQRLKESIARSVVSFDPTRVSVDELSEQMSDGIAEAILSALPQYITYLEDLSDALAARLGALQPATASS